MLESDLQEHRLYVPIDLVDVDPDNTNDHGDASIEAIRGSLERFGQQKPIVVRIFGDRLRCVAGSGQRIAASKLGWDQVWVTISNLDELNASAFGIADNETARHSEQNQHKLANLLRNLYEQNFPVEYIGLEDKKLRGLLARANVEPATPHIEPDRKASATSLSEADNAKNAKPIIVTPAQRAMIDQAVRIVRADEGDDQITEGRAIELICADFLAGDSSKPPEDESDPIEGF